MKRKTPLLALATIAAVLFAAASAPATETENIGVAVLPTPGSVTIDGHYDDWDLSGGIFVCGDVENLRDTMSLWYHAMHDADNLYLLARWTDATPLNNPGVTSGDLGFRGDCLQTRIVDSFGQPDEKVTHLTCWRGHDGRDVINVELGRMLKEGTITDLKALGAKQAFEIAGDGRHYAQEIAIPWAQLAKSGRSPGAGDEVRLAIEANFGIGADGRMTVKDCFQPGVAPDRVFTFRAIPQWGSGKLESTGHITPRRARLSDGRDFVVRMEQGLPVVDWTGLVQDNEIAGFKSIPFDMPADGYASIVLRAADGTVARHLLNCQKLAKGHHDFKWDGLSTFNWKDPGEPVPPGTYQASAMIHQGIGLRLKGWASGGGQTPWDYPAANGNWGGDHGTPVSVTADKDKVYLGWTAAEAGKAVVACDLAGRVVWHHTRGGIGGAQALAVDAGTVYVLDRITTAILYRLDSKSGQYTTWKGRDTSELPVSELFDNFANSKSDRFSMAAANGKLYLASQLSDQVVVLDAATGGFQKRLSLKNPTGLSFSPAGKLFAVTAGTSVVTLEGDTFQPVLENLTAARSVAVDAKGQIFVGVGDPDNQVKIYSADGRLVKSIGHAGGRPLEGPWDSTGVRFVDGIALDAEGKLWVMENDWYPKRVSAWHVDSGKLAHEFFGGTNYGARGGAICPDDPLIVVGSGCEWRIDPKTGLAACTAVVTHGGMESCQFVKVPDGRTYLYVVSTESGAVGPLRIFQRLGDGKYKLRSEVIYVDEAGQELPPSKHGKPSGCKQTVLWADANDDAQRQPDELTGIDGETRFSGWFLWATPDGTMYSKDKQFKLAGLTACGAPRYNFAEPVTMPAIGLGSADSKMLLTFNKEALPHAWMRAFDLSSGKQLWQYPDTFVGVHGSHRAPPPTDGLIRGAFPPCGTAKLPEPIGNIWVIPTNVGEWHVLTEKGFYLTRLFQPDPLHVQWPEAAVPGANVDNVPPGSGGEDFGGSVTLAKDGKLYVQTGKTSFWNIEVVGLDAVKVVPVGSVTIQPADVPLAQKIREADLQATAARQPLWVKRRSPKFTGNLDRDFADAAMLKFEKQEEARVRATATWDDQNLYLGWEVFDQTPWINGTADRDLMYIGGDTVDFQLAVDPAANPKRTDAERGDLRLSIGPFQGKPQAVLYRHVADQPHPRAFSSGVVKDYIMESVTPLDEADVQVKKIGKDRYVVEARVPLAALGLTPKPGMELHGDFGATHGDTAGQRTRLRTFWANQHTGIVDDAVFELKMEPSLWGTLIFTE